MFTGIITDIGIIRSIEQRGDMRVVIGCSYEPGDIAMGASIACSGVCLTVVDKGTDDRGHWFAVDVSGETVSRTAQDQWSEAQRLNLERALKVGDELGGHIVTGHIDGVGEVVGVEPLGDSWKVSIRVPSDLAAHVAGKGSIAVDGVSLTVNTVEDGPDGTVLTLNIIPHTAEMTTLAGIEPGRAVNLEIDILSRYLARFDQVKNAA